MSREEMKLGMVRITAADGSRCVNVVCLALDQKWNVTVSKADRQCLLLTLTPHKGSTRMKMSNNAELWSAMDWHSRNASHMCRERTQRT